MDSRSKKMADINYPVWAVSDLIYRIDINYQVCEVLYQKLNKQNSRNDNPFFLLMANNAFRAAIIDLYTLLKSKDKREIQILPALKKLIKEDSGEKSTVFSEHFEEFTKRIENDYPKLKYLPYTANEIESFQKEYRVNLGENKLHEICKKYEEMEFDVVRHNSSAHTNVARAYVLEDDINRINHRYVKKLGPILKDLKIFAYFCFQFDFTNPRAVEVINVIDQTIQPK